MHPMTATGLVNEAKEVLRTGQADKPKENDTKTGILKGRVVSVLLLSTVSVVAAVAAVITAIFAHYVIAAICAAAALTFVIGAISSGRINLSKEFVKIVKDLIERIRTLQAQIKTLEKDKETNKVQTTQPVPDVSALNRQIEELTTQLQNATQNQVVTPTQNPTSNADKLKIEALEKEIETLKQQLQNQSSSQEQNAQLPISNITEIDNSKIEALEKEIAELKQKSETSQNVLLPPDAPLNLENLPQVKEQPAPILPKNLTTNRLSLKIENPENPVVLTPVPFETPTPYQATTKPETIGYSPVLLDVAPKTPVSQENVIKPSVETKMTDEAKKIEKLKNDLALQKEKVQSEAYKAYDKVFQDLSGKILSKDKKSEQKFNQNFSKLQEDSPKWLEEDSEIKDFSIGGLERQIDEQKIQLAVKTNKFTKLAKEKIENNKESLKSHLKNDGKKKLELFLTNLRPV